MNEYELREHLSDDDIKRLENMRDFHLTLPDHDEWEQERKVEVVIIRDDYGSGGA